MVKNEVSVSDTDVFLANYPDPPNTHHHFSRDCEKIIPVNLSYTNWSKLMLSPVVRPGLQQIVDNNYEGYEAGIIKVIDTALNFEQYRYDMVKGSLEMPDMLAVYILPNAKAGDVPLCLTCRVNDFVQNLPQNPLETQQPRICSFDDLPGSAQSGILLLSNTEKDNSTVALTGVGTRTGDCLFYVLCDDEKREDWNYAE